MVCPGILERNQSTLCLVKRHSTTIQKEYFQIYKICPTKRNIWPLFCTRQGNRCMARHCHSQCKDQLYHIQFFQGKEYQMHHAMHSLKHGAPLDVMWCDQNLLPKKNWMRKQAGSKDYLFICWWWRRRLQVLNLSCKHIEQVYDNIRHTYHATILKSGSTQ